MTESPRLEEVCQRVLDLVGDRAEAEVTAVASRSALTRFANSTIHQNVAEDESHVGLRLVADGRMAAAGGRSDPDGLRRLVERALDAARLRPVDPGWPGLTPASAVAPVTPDTAFGPRRPDTAFGPRRPDTAFGPRRPGRWDPDTAVAPADARAAVVRAFVDAAPDLLAAGFCDSGGSQVAFANSAGRRVSGRVTSATVDGIHRAPGADGSGWQTAGRLADLDGAAAGRTAAAKARRAVDPEPVELEPGRYPVVLEPACVADMVDFLVGEGFSAKAWAEGRSFVRRGETQLDPAVDIWDDATDPRALRLPFDAEGTARRRVDLVEAGVPVGLLHDRRTAAEAGTESTGHAVPGGESYGPAPSTTFLGPGPTAPEELIAGIERGLLVTDFWYTRILDPKTQVVTGLTRNGTFLIERGEVTRGVRNLRFTQSYADALAPGNVVAVGADARLRGTDSVVPSLSLAAWNFTGGASG